MNPVDMDVLTSDVAKLVSLPGIYYRLEDAINDERKSFDDVSQIIMHDPDLAARVLRIANSAFYGFPAQIETITRALTTIGTQQVRDIVLATSVINAFDGMPTHLINLKAFWEHSVAVGVTARVIASWRREVNIERFYIMGLLHDIGRLVLYLKMPEAMQQVLSRRDEKQVMLYRLERETFGFDHAEVGASLMSVWGLPKTICAAVKYHHDPAQTTLSRVDVAVIHVADIMVNSLRMGSSGERFVPPLDESAWEVLGLSENDMPEITGQAQQQTHEALTLFF
ncbi:MAG: HDOD domain-containing protein [Gammaproteobacteria bacterium]|nr:HDOD domain-containing protein [Gammaproteobacteria bacterium]